MSEQPEKVDRAKVESDGRPQIVVVFDPESQTVQLQFYPLAFRTWDFVLGVLEMARIEADRRKRFKEMEVMAAQAEQARRERAMGRLLTKPH